VRTRAGRETMASPEPVSLRACARALGVSDYAVRKAVASGRLPATVVGADKRGKPVITDLSAAITAWEQNAAKPPKTSQTGRLAKAQEALTLERVKEKRFENERTRGEWVRLEDAKREAFESSRVIRERVLNVPSRLAPELAAETDPQKVFARLDAEIRAALHAAADALDEDS
jgi:hypothetical protein